MSIPAGFRGRALKLGIHDTTNAALLLGVDPAHLEAVIEVEAAGSGFDTQGRPKMLFEPHCFYSFLHGEQRNLAVVKGVACERWLNGRYPADSYTVLAEAMLINPHAALLSASWGLGQIMGAHYADVGFSTVEAMVAAACESEAAQLKMLVALLQGRLATMLLRSNWSGFARTYNGPGQVEVYAARLEAAYERCMLRPGLSPIELAANAAADLLNQRELDAIHNTPTVVKT